MPGQHDRLCRQRGGGDCLCPGEATLSGSVWGTDTYTADSATCRAAVHAGMIALTGGTVSVRMLPGQARYPGTTRNGVRSSRIRHLRGQLSVRGRAEGCQGDCTGAGAGGGKPAADRPGPALRDLPHQLGRPRHLGCPGADPGARCAGRGSRAAAAAHRPHRQHRDLGHQSSVVPGAARRACGNGWSRTASMPSGWRRQGRGPSEPIADNATDAGPVAEPSGPGGKDRVRSEAGEKVFSPDPSIYSRSGRPTLEKGRGGVRGRGYLFPP